MSTRPSFPASSARCRRQYEPLALSGPIRCDRFPEHDGDCTHKVPGTETVFTWNQNSPGYIPPASEPVVPPVEDHPAIVGLTSEKLREENENLKRALKDTKAELIALRQVKDSWKARTEGYTGIVNFAITSKSGIEPWMVRELIRQRDQVNTRVKTIGLGFEENNDS